MVKKGWLRSLPWELLLPLLVLTLISLLFIHSASYSRTMGLTLPYAKRQLVRLVVAWGLCVYLATRKLEGSQDWAYFWYLVGIGLLISVFFFGRSAKGATRWILLGPVRIQPSELMKVFYLLGISAYLSRWEWRGPSSLLLPFGLTLFPMLLVLKQPDLGTSLLFLPLLFTLLYLRRTPLPWLLGIAFGLCCLGALAWHLDLLNPYQKRRVYAFLNPEKYAKSIAYQQIQSQIAIGAGGLTGTGLYRGTQTQLGFLPERHTDFIFSVIGEEWGFLGCAFVLGLLYFVVLFILRIGAECFDPFGQLLAAGIGILIGLQTFINTGIAMGILPVTGLTLPFVSYGGSSTVMFWVTIGLVCQVARERR